SFRSGSGDRAIPVADLLPLRESSLALIPTLSIAPQPGTRFERPVRAVANVDVSFQGPVSTSVSISNARTPTAAPWNSSPATATYTETVLSTLLDLNASRAAPRKKAMAQRLSSTRSWPPAERAAGALAEPDAETVGAQAWRYQALSPPPDKVDEV